MATLRACSAVVRLHARRPGLRIDGIVCRPLPYVGAIRIDTPSVKTQATIFRLQGERDGVRVARRLSDIASKGV